MKQAKFLGTIGIADTFGLGVAKYITHLTQQNE